MKRLFLLSAAILMTASLPLSAHHSFAAEYDQKQPVTLQGVVTKLDWMNPHVYFYVDVTDSGGKVTHWACEAGNPNALARRGWKKNSLKAANGSSHRCLVQTDSTAPSKTL